LKRARLLFLRLRRLGRSWLIISWLIISWLIISWLVISWLIISWLIIPLLPRLISALIARLIALIPLFAGLAGWKGPLIAEGSRALLIALILRCIGLPGFIAAGLIKIAREGRSNVRLRLALPERYIFLVAIFRFVVRCLKAAIARILQLVLFLRRSNQSEIMFCVLKKTLGSDIITRCLGIPPKLEVFLGNALRRAPDFDVRAI
jgi:hypothetical protein